MLKILGQVKLSAWNKKITVGEEFAIEVQCNKENATKNDGYV